MRNETVQARPVRRIRVAAILTAALLLFSAIAVAANTNHIIAFITNTMAKNWVLDDTQTLLHTNAAYAALGKCTASVAEWMCDGETLYASLRLTDPELENAHAATDYLGGLNRYALYHGPEDIHLSEGHAGSASWTSSQDEESKNEIIYTLEVPVEVSADTFTVTIPVVCSEGKMNLHFDVKRSDFGRIRMFEPSAVLQVEGYTAQITRFKATALHSYATLEMVFDESIPQARRHEIAADYLDGLCIPEGKLDIIAGEGEEIIMARSEAWSEDGSICTLELRGNPRENYPETVVYCPRWGAHDEDGGLPPLSMNGAILMEMKEVLK